MANRFDELVRLYESLPVKAVVDLGEEYADIARSEAQADRMPFRNQGAGPTARPDGGPLLSANGRYASELLYASPAGIWSWMEYGVPNHMVGRARSQRTVGSSNRRQAVQTPEGPRMYAHAGYPVKGTWSKAVKNLDSIKVDIVGDAYRATVR